MNTERTSHSPESRRRRRRLGAAALLAGALAPPTVLLAVAMGDRAFGTEHELREDAHRTASLTAPEVPEAERLAADEMLRRSYEPNSGISISDADAAIATLDRAQPHITAFEVARGQNGLFSREERNRRLLAGSAIIFSIEGGALAVGSLVRGQRNSSQSRS